VGAITGIFHGGVTVSDMDRALAFYRDGLGLEVEFDRILDGPYLPVVLDLDFSQIRAVYLRVPGGVFIELLEYQGIERLSAAARPCDPGAGHLCLYVDGIDEIVERLQAAGFRARSDGPVDITAGPNKGARSIYLQDPDGYPVELIQRRPGG
jgi:catechol 2,3-dioxygenase-like lactoylglutathione lyase family enzyme